MYNAAEKLQYQKGSKANLVLKNINFVRFIWILGNVHICAVKNIMVNSIEVESDKEKEVVKNSLKRTKGVGNIAKYNQDFP